MHTPLFGIALHHLLAQILFFVKELCLPPALIRILIVFVWDLYLSPPLGWCFTSLSSPTYASPSQCTQLGLTLDPVNLKPCLPHDLCKNLYNLSMADA